MKSYLIAAVEIGLVMFLLFTNVLMGLYVQSERPTLTFMEKIHEIATIENIALAFTAGVVVYLVTRQLRHANN